MNHPLISRDDYGRYGAFNDPLYICNPVTREYILLPICGEKCRRNVFGFGYNDKTNEYKVVRISYESDEHTEPGQVQVYTIGAGTGWRNKGEIAYSLQTNNSHSPGVHADGEIYWLHQKILPWKAEVPGKLMKSNFDRIVAFNLADEVFRLLPMLPDYPLLPGDPNFALPCYYRIQVLGGCLCYMRLEGSADVWSFNKKNDSSGGSFNEKEEDSSNWSLAGTLQSERDCGKDFLALTKNGEILYWDDEKTYLSYNLRTESIKELLNDVTTGLDVFETIRHEYSFVSLEALGEENVRMFGRIN
ncbi:hypothetical protein C5167_010668 [Papaver somniferum]|uniref:F-box associated beta-propeller type 3 domain-containing protein n=1 Tax=Papaver somniferum TaxID=3469 RepID=A0A4Y7K403_PAPSO|nr:hypothetical protein C5167_010668 [Papaver somniferum]